MTKKEKLWKKAQKSPQNLTFDEFETLLTQTGWTLNRQRGSHRLWYSPQWSVITNSTPQRWESKSLSSPAIY